MAKVDARRYMDSDVIVRLVENRPEAQIIERLEFEASEGSWTIVVSALSVIEVSTRPAILRWESVLPHLINLLS